MQNQKIDISKFLSTKRSSKGQIGNIFTSRKSSKNLKRISKAQLSKITPTPNILTSRQNPKCFLQSIQNDHKQIQQSLGQSHLGSSKWRSYNSPVETPNGNKQNIFLETIFKKRQQINAIKVYNHVHNNTSQLINKRLQQPQFVQFIQQAVSKSIGNTKVNQNQNKTKNNKESTQRKFSRLKKGFDIKHNYTIGDHRKQLQNLQTWIKNKVQCYETEQISGEIMFIQRIDFLNMAFGQVSRICGTYSTQSKQMIEYLYKKNYQFYNFLIECMMEQNNQIKTQITTIEDRLFKTINHYEEKIQKIKIQNEQKSVKILENFHKCIEVKKKLEKENKEYKRNYLNEKKKVKLMEEGLIKVITLFLALGHKNIEEMTFTMDSGENETFASTMLAKSKKHILTEQQRQMQKRKQIFQEWCGYLIKMIHRIVMKDSKDRQSSSMKFSLFKGQAFQIIQKYMVQNDDSLSMTDAQKILNNFICSQEQEKKLKCSLTGINEIQKKRKQKQLKDLQVLNRKFQTMYSQISYQLPTFEDVYNKISYKDIDVQVNIRNQTQNSANQTFIQTIQTGVLAVPRMKGKQIDMSTDLRQRITLQSCVYSLDEIYKLKKQKHPKLTEKINEKIKTQIYESQQGHSQSHSRRVTTNGNDDENKSQFSRTDKTLKSKFSYDKSQNQNLIDIVFGQGSKRQIGINTMMSKLNNKKRTVEFNIPQLQQHQNYLRDSSLTPDEHSAVNKQNSSSQTVFIQDSNSQNLMNRSEPVTDSIKEIESKSDVYSHCGQIKGFRGRRKNGFIITGDRKKTHLSQKFIFNPSQTSIASNESGDSEEERMQNVPLNRQSSLNSEISEENNRISIQKVMDSQNSPDSKKKKFKNFEQKLAFNRSFFNLANVQYRSKEDADINRIKDHVVRVPKRKTMRQKCLIDPHDFHLQLAFKNHEKIKFLSSITLWHPKLMIEMKKIRHRVKNLKPLPEINSTTNGLIKGYFTHIINPIMKDLLKSYCQELNNDRFEFGGDTLMNSSFKGFKNLALNKKISESSSSQNSGQKNKNSQNNLSYHNRLSPLLYNFINYTQYNQNKTSTDNQIYFSGMKTLKYQSARNEVYNLLMEGGSVEIDIFIKSIYHFNLTVNINLTYDPELSHFILQTGLTQILEGYFIHHQIKKILEEVKSFILTSQAEVSLFRRTSLKNEFKRDSLRNNSSVRTLNNDSKISFYQLLKIIFKFIKKEQQHQVKKYSIIIEIISRNSQCTSYEDIMHFLSCLPIQSDKRRKILKQCLKRINYWQKVQASIPNDILFFILDKQELYISSGTSQSNTVIKEYIINRCELYFKATLQKVYKSPQWVLNSTYLLSYKIPKVLHRILYQIKTGRNIKQKKLLICLLTTIFCNLIDTQMDKCYMPSLFNGLISIPV